MRAEDCFAVFERDLLPAKACFTKAVSAGQIPDKAGHDWYDRTTVDSYNVYGSRNPAWDDQARKALVDAAGWWRGDPQVFPILVEASCRKAIDAGCDDPLVIYAFTTARQAVEELSEMRVQNTFLTAAKRMAGTEYPAIRKCWMFTRAAYNLLPPEAGNSAGKAEAAEMLISATIDLLPAVLKDDSAPPKNLAAFCSFFIDAVERRHGSRDAGMRMLSKVFKQHLPSTNPLLHIIKGNHHWKTAWRARGGGYAGTVSENGSKVFCEQIMASEQSFLKAWQMNTNSAYVATKLLKINAVQCGHNMMEIWFQRAVKADPNYYDAYKWKLFYLTPKWGGSKEAMLAFGKECVAASNWSIQIPFILVAAHLELARRGGLNNRYYLRPGVWEDMASVYQPYLKRFPDNSWCRTKYARFAVFAHKLQVAKEQFDILGEEVRIHCFENKAELRSMQRQAQEYVAKSNDVKRGKGDDSAFDFLASDDVGGLKQWLADGGNANAKDATGASLLVAAVLDRKTKIVKLLLKHGADPNAKDLKGTTVLILSINRYADDIARLLVEAGADMNMRCGDDQRFALSIAGRKDDAEIAEFLIDNGAKLKIKNKNGETVLDTMARLGRIDMIELLLKKGANVECRNRFEYTPLMTAITKKRQGAVELLLEKGADVNAQTSANTTPLIIASYRGFDGIIDVLIEHKADLEVLYTRDGKTALMFAAEGGHEKAVKLLLKAGANSKTKTRKGQTAASIARSMGHTELSKLLSD